MDLVRRHVRGGPGVDVVRVALRAVRQRSDGERRTAVGRVFAANEAREILVRRDDVDVDRVGDLPCQACLVRARDGCRIFSGGNEERVGVDDARNLDGDFLEQESDWHEPVVHASAENFGCLIEGSRYLVKARDVVLVLLDCLERNGQRQIRKAQVDAVELVDRHLILFEIEVGEALPQHPNQKVVGELVLLGEARGRYGFKAGEKILIGLVALTDGRERVLGELVVVAVVAEGGGALRKVAEIRLVLLFEERVLGGDALSNWFDVLG